MTKQAKILTDAHDLDECHCGDWRKDHEPNGGRCRKNGLGHGVPGFTCEKFVLAFGYLASIPDWKSE